MKAVIMAGGKGTRLRPLTCNMPKPMAPIANRPMMAHIVELLKKHGFNEVMATLFYLPESIRDYFGDGRDFEMKIRYYLEETPLGTAGSVKNGEEFLDGTFLVISGDTLTDINLEAAVKFHQQKRATATLVLTKVDNPLEYGVVITDSDGQIKRFLEKPGWGEVFSDTVNTGIYVLDPKIFDYFKRGQVFDFSKDLFPLLLEKNEPLYGYIAEGYWSDIGNLEQYRQAHFDILTGKVQVSIPGKEIKPGVWVGEGTSIADDAVVEGPAILGDFCQVGPRARVGEFTIIGDYGTIRGESSVKRSILWDHCYIGDNSELRGAILCHHSSLRGNNSLFEGVVLGESVSLGLRATLKPQVKVWPAKNIESGTVLNDSLIWAKKYSKSLFGNMGITGIVNQEITPELVVKLGAALGAHLKPGAKIVASSDDFRASRVLKRALVAGALSAGVSVYDLGTMATPLTRYALVTLGAKGGVHLRIDPDHSEGVVLEFMDHQGMNLDKNAERALENAFFSEDFPRASVQSMGELTFVPKLFEPYLQGLLGSEVQTILNKAHFTVVVADDGGSLSLILPGLFVEMGCRMVHADGILTTPGQPKTFRELLSLINSVGNQIRTTGASLGVVVENNGERLILLDENGEIVKEEQITALVSYLMLKYRPEATVPVPVTAPHFLEELAQKYHGKVIRTKANPRSIMEKTVQEKLFPSANGENVYHPQFDALFCLVKIMELLARERIKLSEAKELMPRVERGYREAECPWEHKGRIMRNLFEENKDKPLEMTDGLKVIHDHGWALVLPDAEEPIFKIYSEANTTEEADALTSLYMNRINELQAQ